jgi:hypothetical protein
MTRAFRSIAGVGVEVVNATGAGVASTVELSLARGRVELISACFCGLSHPAEVRPLPTQENVDTYWLEQREYIALKENFETKYLARAAPQTGEM